MNARCVSQQHATRKLTNKENPPWRNSLYWSFNSAFSRLRHKHARIVRATNRVDYQADLDRYIEVQSSGEDELIHAIIVGNHHERLGQWRPVAF